MKKLTLKTISVGLCLLGAILANNAQAQNGYFDVNGTTAGYGVANGLTYSWDDLNWAPASGGATATAAWVSGDFARFYGGGSGVTYTVTVNAAENNTGLYNNSASTVIINDAGNNTGSLNVITAIQGFLTGSGSVIINAPITGDGGVAPESAGSLYLNAANTYTGGTALGDSGNTLTYFNNNNAFSTGPITLNRTGNFSTLLGTGGSPLTLANNFSTVAANTGPLTELNFASSANTPVTSSGTWNLGTVNVNLRSSGGSTAPLTLSGVISGSGNLILSANGSGSKTILSGANNFTGQITITGSGGTYGGSGAATLQLGAENAIASSSMLVMNGGTFNPGGFNQFMTSTKLSVEAGQSYIDFISGPCILEFADSSDTAWIGTLNLENYDPSKDIIVFGNSNTALTSAQLASIDVDGVSAGATLAANGYLILTVPEPSPALLGMVGGLCMIWIVKRRKA